MSGITNTTALTSIATQSLTGFSEPQPVSNLVEGAEVSSILSKNDAMSSSVNTGTVPASKINLVGKIANTTSTIAKNTVSTTVNATRQMGTVITNEVMPKPEPLSATIVRNKFLSAVLVGGFVNGVTAVAKVAQGQYTQEEAKKAVVKDTTLGAVSGLSFASGMGLTATAFGRVMGGVPLSLAALTVGTLASLFTTQFVKSNVDFFTDKKNV